MINARKGYALVVGGILLVTVSVIFWRLTVDSGHVEVLVSNGTALSEEPVEFAVTLDTRYPWSELLIEVPARSDDLRSKVHGYVTTDSGKRIELTTGSVVEYGNRVFLRMSAESFEPSGRVVKLKSVVLRADAQTDVRSVVWLSYDPAKTKSGIAYPTLNRD